MKKKPSPFDFIPRIKELAQSKGLRLVSVDLDRVGNGVTFVYDEGKQQSYHPQTSTGFHDEFERLRKI